MLNKIKMLITIASLEESQRKSPKIASQTEKGPYKKPLWEEQSPTKCSKKKKKEFWIEDGLDKSSKKAALGEHRQVASL